VVSFTPRSLYSQGKRPWHPKPFWTRWWREKFPAPAGNRIHPFINFIFNLIALIMIKCILDHGSKICRDLCPQSIPTVTALYLSTRKATPLDLKTLIKLTNSMQQSPSWEDDSHLAIQKVPVLSLNPMLHYPFFKTLSMIPVLSHTNPVHILFTIHFSIIRQREELGIKNYNTYIDVWSRDSSVVWRWATGWTIRVLRFDSRRALGILLFTTASRTALEPTQPPIQWVPGALSLGVMRQGLEADHSPPSSAEVKECVELYLHSPNTSSWHGA
jgi:hypothetical protein